LFRQGFYPTLPYYWNFSRGVACYQGKPFG